MFQSFIIQLLVSFCCSSKNRLRPVCLVFLVSLQGSVQSTRTKSMLVTDETLMKTLLEPKSSLSPSSCSIVLAWSLLPKQWIHSQFMERNPKTRAHSVSMSGNSSHHLGFYFPPNSDFFGRHLPVTTTQVNLTILPLHETCEVFHHSHEVCKGEKRAKLKRK